MNRNSSRRINNKGYKLLYFFIYMLLFVECIFGICTFSFTRDGGFTFGIIHKSFYSIIRLTSIDVHPFLYYFIAKLLIIPFHNNIYQIIILRILSAIPYLVLLVIGNTTIKHKFGNNISLIFMFLILTMPVVNNYVFILRMYSMAMMFTTCAYIVFVYVYKRYLSNSLKTFILISIFSLLASYSHYYSLIISVIMYVTFFILFLFKKRKVKYIIYSSIIDVMAYSPWMFVLVKQFTDVRHGFWNTPITFTNILTSVLNLACPLHGVLIHIIPILLIIIIIFIFIAYHEYNNLIILTGFIIGAGTVIVSIILSILVHHSVLQSRYLVPTMGIVWLAIAVLVSDSHVNHMLRNSVLILLITIGLVNYSYNLFQLRSNSSQYNNTIENIENLSKQSTIIYDGDLPNYISSYHLHKNIYLTYNHSNLYNKNTKVYCKVYDLTSENNINFQFSKKAYFIAPVKRDVIGDKFYSRYRMNRIKYVYIPNDSGSKILKCVLYKIHKY